MTVTALVRGPERVVRDGAARLNRVNACMWVVVPPVGARTASADEVHDAVRWAELWTISTALPVVTVKRP